MNFFYKDTIWEVSYDSQQKNMLSNTLEKALFNVVVWNHNRPFQKCNQINSIIMYLIFIKYPNVQDKSPFEA